VKKALAVNPAKPMEAIVFFANSIGVRENVKKAPAVNPAKPMEATTMLLVLRMNQMMMM
jgi:hypothetical protein